MRAQARAERQKGRPRVDAVVLVAFAIDTALAVVDALTPIVLIGLVVVGPLIAATRVGPRRTGLIGLYAVALAIYEGIPHHIFGTPDHLVRCAAIALTGGLAVWSAWLRTRREATQRRVALLAEAAPQLGASLDAATTVRNIVELVVTRLADCCAVHTFDRRGGVAHVVVAAADATGEPVAEALRRARPPAASAAQAGDAAGDAVEALADALRAAARDGDDLAALGSTRSTMIVPLVARGRTLGAITVVTLDPRRRYDETDRAVAIELASRCAIALDNAGLFEERSNVARTLQDSLLPTRLPELPGLEVAARFHAGDDVEVGGDFFDVFPCDGASAAVIGDVAGKGAGAAAVTALARYTVRAVADGRAPSAVLRALNDALLRHELDERFCTAAYALVHPGPEGATVRLCSAGHPPALVVRGDGRAVPVGAAGMALGIAADPPLRDADVRLAPGEKLVFYTDGVTEARVGSRMMGVAGLADVLATTARADALRTGEQVYRAASSAGGVHDDIAVLVLRASAGAAEQRGNEGLARTGASGRRGVLHLRLVGGPQAPWDARRALDALEIPVLAPADAHRARLLVSEIVSNSVRHANGDAGHLIGFDADLTPDMLHVAVRDDGPGFQTDPRRPPTDEASRQGLVLIDRLADRWGTRDDGRCVWFELDRRA